MRPGYELVREQVFFRKELRERVLWVIKIRWVFAALALTGLAVAASVGLKGPVLPLAGVCAAALVYNAAFAVIARWIERCGRAGGATFLHLRPRPDFL